MTHIPVLLHEVMEALDPQAGEFFIDGTFGGGGYTRALLKRVGETGMVLALDLDASAIKAGEALTKEYPNLTLREGNFAELPDMFRGGDEKPTGLVLDLGFSSDQIMHRGRGFSFGHEAANEPLLMTYSDNSTPVAELIRTLSEDDLRSIIRKLGEERFAGRVARALKNASRKTRIHTAGEFADVIRKALPGNYERGRIDPATRTFQAFRMYANQELENLERILTELPEVFESGARIGIVTFHSLEDRIVKNHFRSLVSEGLMTLVSAKPITPSREEVTQNPRSRSAKLRVGRLL